MSRGVLAVLIGLLAVVLAPIRAEAGFGDPTYDPPQGSGGSTTEHLFNPRLGGCLFGIGSRPVNPDDVPSAGICRRPSRPDTDQPPAQAPIDIALDVAFGLPWRNPVPHTAPAWQSGTSLTGIPTW